MECDNILDALFVLGSTFVLHFRITFINQMQNRTSTSLVIFTTLDASVWHLPLKMERKTTGISRYWFMDWDGSGRGIKRNWFLSCGRLELNYETSKRNLWPSTEWRFKDAINAKMQLGNWKGLWEDFKLKGNQAVVTGIWRRQTSRLFSNP